MSKCRKSVSDDVLPDPSPIEITDSQECIPSNHDEVFKPFDNSEDDPLPQEDGSDTASDPITSDCEEDTSEHRLEFVMKMPDCVVDPESREKVIRYFQQEQGGTNCWGEVKAFLETAECTMDENGNPHFSNQLNTLNNLTLQETIGELDWAWRNSLFTVFLQSGMVSLNVKKDN